MVKRAIAAGAIVAACAPPEFTYVKNPGAKTYFKVPHEWRQIGTESVDDALSGSTPDSTASTVRQQLWSVTYDPSPERLAEHAARLVPALPLDRPGPAGG